MKHNICIVGISEGEEEQGIENQFEKVMMENFHNLMTEKATQVRKRNTKSPLQDTS